MGAPKIKTRVLILSDTHGLTFTPPSIPVDVLIHCGDLTDGSLLSEYTLTASVLASINAPLKLAIPGNHDFALDTPAFAQKVNEASPPLDPDDVQRYYGAPGDAKAILEKNGVRVLDEGVHVFKAGNGGLLRVYASPFTPSVGCGWGFQYHPDTGHEFDISHLRSSPSPSPSLIGSDSGSGSGSGSNRTTSTSQTRTETSNSNNDGASSPNIDIALTHGPPRGILDHTSSRARAGCPDLFTAISSARPQLHAFGHIHEAWGAKLVTWRDPRTYRAATHFTAIDNNHTSVISTLSTLQQSKFDSEDEVLRKRRKWEEVEMQGYVKFEGGIERGKQTLFVNASIVDSEGTAGQVPWIVEVDLDRDGVEAEFEAETEMKSVEGVEVEAEVEAEAEAETEMKSVEGAEVESSR